MSFLLITCYDRQFDLKIYIGEVKVQVDFSKLFLIILYLIEYLLITAGYYNQVRRCANQEWCFWARQPSRPRIRISYQNFSFRFFPSVFMFRRHTFTLCEKFFNSFLHDLLQVCAVAQRILENIELEQLGDILDTLLRIHHEHRNQKIHEALWYFTIFIQEVCMRMVLEELRVSRLQR